MFSIIPILIAPFLFLSSCYTQSIDTHQLILQEKTDTLYNYGRRALQAKAFNSANEIMSSLLKLNAIDHAISLRNSYFYIVINEALLCQNKKDHLLKKNFKAIYDAGTDALLKDDFVHGNDIMMWLASLGDIEGARKIESLFLSKLATNKDITYKHKKLMREQQFETIYVQGQRALYYYQDPDMLQKIICWLNEYHEGQSWGAQLAQEELKENLKKETTYLNNSDSFSTECYYPTADEFNS